MLTKTKKTYLLTTFERKKNLHEIEHPEKQFHLFESKPLNQYCLCLKIVLDDACKLRHPCLS